MGSPCAGAPSPLRPWYFRRVNTPKSGGLGRIRTYSALGAEFTARGWYQFHHLTLTGLFESPDLCLHSHAGISEPVWVEGVDEDFTGPKEASEAELQGPV